MGCKDCPFAGRKKVKYERNNPEFVVIGECPGREECTVGKPFVGSSGRLLMKTFSLFGMKRKDISILNAMMCPKYPSDSRTDIEKATKQCKPNVMKALSILKPKVVVLLGELALYSLFNKKKISKFRGITIDSGYKVIPTFHPAYVTRNCKKGYPEIPVETMNEIEKLFYSDIKHAVAILKGKDTLNVNYSTINIPDNGIVAFDIETENLLVAHTKGKVLSIALAGEDGVFASIVKKNRLKKKIKEILENPKVKKIVHNRPFDELVCLNNLKCKVKGQIFDTMTMAHIVDENMISYKLEHLANVYTSRHNIKDIVSGDRSSLSSLPEDQLLSYVSLDAEVTFEIFNVLKKKIAGDKQLLRYYTYYFLPVENTFADVSRNGWKIDLERLDRNEDKLLEQQEALLKELLEPLPKSLKSDTLTPEVISKYMFSKKGLNLKPLERTEKTNEPSTNKYHLKRFRHIEWVSKLLQYKQISKILNTYIKAIRKNIYPDGYIYPKIFLTGTVTGRTVILDPAMQQFPTHGDYAKIILENIVAEDGWLICSHDLSQSEMRIAGWLAGDENILNALQQGIDLHIRTASLISGVPFKKVTKEMRQNAKAVNFGLLYGMQAPSLVDYAFKEYDIEISLKEAQTYRQKFFSKPDGYWKLPLYHRRMVRIAQFHKQVRCVLGRIRHLPHIDSRDSYLRSKAERQAINTPVQNFSSELACLGIMLFRKEINSNPKLKSKVKLTNLFIHDAYYYRAKEDVAEKTQEILKDCFENRTKEYIWKYWKIEIGYPIETEGKIGKDLSFSNP